MANDFSLENIYSYHTLYKCQMAIVARDLALKMRHTPLCNEEKIRFILAMIYVKMMAIRSNDNSCIDDDTICELSSYIKKYLGRQHSSTRDCGCS